MPDPKGFLTTPRQLPRRRPVDVRIRDWREVHEEFDATALRKQAGRCMDCGVPFCHSGCPLGNLIPEWNDLVWRDDWREAVERLHATNNFPEFTGKLCPAPCEPACVLAINAEPVTIKQVEAQIIDRAWQEGWVTPQPPADATGKKVAVVGSGPAGLAAAQQLTRAGHHVVVYERADRLGGLLRYGVPEFKMEKRFLDRRLAQLRAEGTEFRTGVNVGVDVTTARLRESCDAIVLACGALAARELRVPGRELGGVYPAMEYLEVANRVCEGDLVEPSITARGKNVVIVGGGDTGADCFGTALRQGAKSVVQLQIHPRPPDARPEHQPWPTYPLIYRVCPAHEEGGERTFAVSTQELLGDSEGRVRGLRLIEVEFADGRFRPVPGTEQELACELALLALGFVGPQRDGLLEELGVAFTERGTLSRDSSYMTNVEGVFVAGDAGRGQSLIVWAIAEGRAAAAAVDEYLTGHTVLPAPIAPTARPLT